MHDVIVFAYMVALDKLCEKFGGTIWMGICILLIYIAAFYAVSTKNHGLVCEIAYICLTNVEKFDAYV